MEVTLLKTDGLREAFIAAKRCYSNDTSAKIALDADCTCEAIIQRFLKEKILDKGHMQALEPLVFWYALDGISRSTAHQIVRKRHSSICEKSLRRTDPNLEFSLDGFVIPESIRTNMGANDDVTKLLYDVIGTYNDLIRRGIPKEDARCVLPLATKTSMVLTLNFSSLWGLFSTRTCMATQAEHRDIANRMLDLARAKYPILLKEAGAPCKRGEKCIGGHPCKK